MARKKLIRKKILLGPLDSGLNYDLKIALGKLGYQVTTLNFIEQPFRFPSDINLKINKVSWLTAAGLVWKNFLRSFSYDIYHFRLGQSLLPSNLDLPFLKIAKKKIVFNFDGDDVRIGCRFAKTKYNRIFAKNNVQEHLFGFVKKILKYRWIKLWADQLTVVTPDLLEFALDAKLVFNLVPTSIRKNSPLKKSTSNTIKILHVPTDQKIKGTSYIIRAVKRLKKEKYPIELVVFANKPHNEVDDYYRQADIVIDQLLVGATGLVSYEAMLYGKPVLCYIREDLLHYYPKDLPVVNANPDTIYEVLRDLIDHKKKIQEIGKKSLAYVKRVHYPGVVAKKWDQIYKEL